MKYFSISRDWILVELPDRKHVSVTRNSSMVSCYRQFQEGGDFFNVVAR